MSKATKPKSRQKQNKAAAPSPKPDELAGALAALKEATTVLAGAASQLQQLARSGVPAGGAFQAAAIAPEINTWDDPFSEAVPSLNPTLTAPISVSVTLNANPRLRTAIVEAELPAARYAMNTDGFRYWVAAEALARGINFWETLLPAGTTWSTSNPMRVVLVDAGPQLNAKYDRNDGLHFYQQSVGNFDIRASESPDVVCHELGHAVLDAVRPQLFNTADAEVGAFHESFGDMSAILCAIQLPSLRQGFITETQGHLNVNSRLSRLAEQLGWGIRQLSPTAVDRDCLRNAANRFFYRAIDEVPPSAPANLLSSEVHSFSRVFTGAFLDVLARMFSAAGTGEANLLAAGRDLGQLVIDAVRAAPVTTGYFSQVAAAMIQADQARFAGRNRAALDGAFLERGILSVSSSMAMSNEPLPKAVAAQITANLPEAGMVGSPTTYAYQDDPADDGYRLGYGQTPELPTKSISIGGGAINIEVHAPTELRRFKVQSAMVGSGTATRQDADTAVRVFVEGLIQRREVDLGLAQSQGGKPSSRATHSLVSEGGKRVLKRNHFECGWCARTIDPRCTPCD
jgi:hypothetical protein